MCFETVWNNWQTVLFLIALWSQEETNQCSWGMGGRCRKSTGCRERAGVPRENSAVSRIGKLLPPKHSCSSAVLRRFWSREDELKMKEAEWKWEPHIWFWKEQWDSLHTGCVPVSNGTSLCPHRWLGIKSDTARWEWSGQIWRQGIAQSNAAAWFCGLKT